MSDTFNHEADAWDSLNDDNNEPVNFRQRNPWDKSCRTCGKIGLAWVVWAEGEGEPPPEGWYLVERGGAKHRCYPEVEIDLVIQETAEFTVDDWRRLGSKTRNSVDPCPPPVTTGPFCVEMVHGVIMEHGYLHVPDDGQRDFKVSMPAFTQRQLEWIAKACNMLHAKEPFPK